jgi:plastocyanin
MKNFRFLFVMLIGTTFILNTYPSFSTIHVIRVWDGYFQFTPNQITIPLGDTIHWLPLDQPTMLHTITSVNIPPGAAPFDQIWQAPADTFFQYVPTEVGLYLYECTPHASSFNMIGSFIIYPPVGIGDPAAGDQVEIFPNPASDFLHLNGVQDGMEYRIIDQAGKLVVTGLYQIRINISGLSDGIYYLEVFGDNVQRRKFMIRQD